MSKVTNYEQIILKCRLVEMLPDNLQQLFILQIFLHDYGLVVSFLFFFSFFFVFRHFAFCNGTSCTLLNSST